MLTYRVASYSPKMPSKCVMNGPSFSLHPFHSGFFHAPLRKWQHSSMGWVPRYALNMIHVQAQLIITKRYGLKRGGDEINFNTDSQTARMRHSTSPYLAFVIWLISRPPHHKLEPIRRCICLSMFLVFPLLLATCVLLLAPRTLGWLGQAKAGARQVLH